MLLLLLLQVPFSYLFLCLQLLGSWRQLGISKCIIDALLVMLYSVTFRQGHK
jgi:hypothetical protein